MSKAGKEKLKARLAKLRAREALGSLVEQLRSAQARIKQLEVTLLAWHRSNEASRRLATIPGVGVITATALVATIGDGAQFRSGRQLSAWLGPLSANITETPAPLGITVGRWR